MVAVFDDIVGIASDFAPYGSRWCMLLLVLAVSTLQDLAIRRDDILVERVVAVRVLVLLGKGSSWYQMLTALAM